MEALKNVTFKKPSVRRMGKGKSAKRLGGMDAGTSGSSGAPGNEEVAKEYLELLKEFDGRTATELTPKIGSAVVTETEDDDDILGVREPIRDFEAEIQEILNEALSSRVAVDDGMFGWEDMEADTFEARQPRISEETNSESLQLAAAAEPPTPATGNEHAILEAIFNASSNDYGVSGEFATLKDLAAEDHIATAEETPTAVEADREALATNKASSDDGGISATLTLKDLAAAGHIATAAEPPTLVEADREASEALKNVTYKKPSVKRMGKGKSATRSGGMEAGTSGASGAPGNEEVAEEYLEMLKEFEGREGAPGARECRKEVEDARLQTVGLGRVMYNAPL
ncbi:hypothetical protein HDU96_008057 [Phlyctochytrium bullatum]|nr:hypothetical protein HDU96_008057 [Phlyctochytrium bullatum]